MVVMTDLMVDCVCLLAMYAVAGGINSNYKHECVRKMKSVNASQCPVTT